MFKKVKGKLVAVSAAVGSTLMSGAALATPSSAYPATLEDAAAFLEGKGELAIALTVLMTVIVLGIKFSKLPRRS
jgi:hypothetical protein